MNHPILPCGLNSDDINGDEANGAGTNWPIWPVLFDTFESLIPLIITEEMLKVFEVMCSDICFAWENNSIAPSFEELTQVIAVEEEMLLVTGESERLVLSRETQTQAIPRSRDSLTIVGKSDTLTLPGKARKAG